MDSRIEQKMLKMIIFQYEISTGVVRALFESHIFQRFPGSNFEGFINTPDITHILFHLYHDKIECCKCQQLPRGKGKLLTESQFSSMFCMGDASPHLKTSIKGEITQYCLCKVTAKTGVTMDKCDISLMVGIFQNCFEQTGDVFKWLKKIRDIRNQILHIGSLFTSSEDELNDLFQDAENVVLNIAKVVRCPSYEKSVKTQIKILKCAALHEDDVKHLISAMESIRREEKKTIVQFLSEKTERLDKQQKELLENQDEIKNTQGHHTDQLNTIQDISEDVQTITSETKKEQSQQTVIITSILDSVEKLETMSLGEEEKEGLRQLKAKLNNMSGVCHGECQTDVDSIQFDLEEHLKTELKGIRTDTNNIQTQNDNAEMTLRAVSESVERIYEEANAKSVLKIMRDHIGTRTYICDKHIATALKLLRDNMRWRMTWCYIREHRRKEMQDIYTAFKAAVDSQILVFKPLLFSELVISNSSTRGTIQQMTNSVCHELQTIIKDFIQNLFSLEDETLDYDCCSCDSFIKSLQSYVYFCERCICEYFSDIEELSGIFVDEIYRHQIQNAYNLFLELLAMSSALTIFDLF